MRDLSSGSHPKTKEAPRQQKGSFKKKNKLEINEYNHLVRPSSSKHNSKTIKNQIRDLKRFIEHMTGKVASEVIDEKKKQLREFVGMKKASRAKTFITLKYKEIRANELKKINRRIRKLEKENGDPEEIEKYKRLGVYCHDYPKGRRYVSVFVKDSQTGEQNVLNQEKMEYFEEVVQEIEKSRQESQQAKKEKMKKEVDVSLGKKTKEKKEEEDEFFSKDKRQGKQHQKKYQAI